MSVLALLASLLSAAPAAAVPPTNDDIADAIDISGAGFTDTRNTAEATYVSSDPGCGAATVWYSFTPTTDGRFLFENVGSNYDTMLAVLVGSPGALTMISCHDDDSDLNERIVLDATAGTTYYIQAASCCGADNDGQVGPGGDLVFQVSMAPPAMDVRATIKRTGAVNRFGAAVVRGALVCNTPAEADISVRIRQRQGSRVVTAGSAKSMRCSTARRRWTVGLENDTRSFKRRLALVRISVLACDGLSCDRSRRQRAVILRAP